MLSALLLAGLFAAPIATVALFLPTTRRPRRDEKPSRQLGRFALSLVWSAIVIAVVGALLALIGVTTGNIEAAVIGLVVAALVWLPVSRRWSARAHVCWATTTYLFAIYLAFMVWWTFASGLGIAGTVGGLLLWALEVVAAFLGCAYLWELCDTLGRASWLPADRRPRAGPGPRRPVPVGLPPGPLLQRAAGHGHRDARVAALAGLPELRDRGDRRQHR